MTKQDHRSIDSLVDDGPEGVLRAGKIFEAGEYPERGFTLTVPELEAAAAAFSPLPLKLQHVDTPLDGKLGVLESLHVAGAELIGRARLPRWLDRLIPDKRVSCGWDRATKRLAELSLVTEPRITDAVLYAACSADREMAANLADTAYIDQSKETNDPMNFKEWLAKLRALFSALPPGDESGEGETTAGSADDADQLRSQIDALLAKQRQIEAASFADGEIRARRAYPSERAPLIAAFMRAMDDDAEHPDLARFTTGDAPATRVATLKAMLAARTPHVLTDELLDPSRAARALFHEAQTSAESSAELRRAELLSQTQMGRDILKTEKGK